MTTTTEEVAKAIVRAIKRKRATYITWRDLMSEGDCDGYGGDIVREALGLLVKGHCIRVKNGTGNDDNLLDKGIIFEVNPSLIEETSYSEDITRATARWLKAIAALLVNETADLIRVASMESGGDPYTLINNTLGGWLGDAFAQEKVFNIARVVLDVCRDYGDRITGDSE